MQKLRQLENYRKDGIEQEIYRLEYEINTQSQIDLRPDQFKLVQNRDTILREMLQEIQMLNDIGNDLAVMVYEQNEQIQSITDKIQNTYDDANDGLGNTRKAVRQIEEINKKKCIILTAVIAFILIIIVLVVVLSVVLSLQ